MVTLSDYEAFKLKQKNKDVGAAGIVLSQDFAETPDQAASDLNLAADHAKLTGAPVAPSALVKEYRSTFQQNADRLKADTVLSSSPTLAAWLREPDNAAVSRDDLENLSWFEQQGRGAIGALDRGMKQVEVGFDQAAANSFAQRSADQGRDFGAILADEGKRTPAGLALIFAGWRQTTAMLDSAFGNDVAGKAAAYQQRAAEVSAKLAAIPKTANAQAIDGWMQNMDWSSPDALTNVIQNVALNPVGFAEWVTQVGLEVTPQLAAATAVTAVTRNPAAGAMVFGGSSVMTNTGAQSLEFVQEAGYDLTTPKGALAAISDKELMSDAYARGAAYGLVVGAMDTLSGGVAGETLAHSHLTNLFLQTMLQAGMAGTGETAGQLAAGMQLDPTSIFAEMLGEVGSAPAEVMGVGGKAFLDRQAKAKSAEDRVTLFKELAGQSTSSRLRERMPDKFRQFIERATANGPVESVYVPADKFVEYFQGQGVDPAVMAASLNGVTVADLTVALETGGDLKIPTASYAASIAGSNHDAWLMENMRFSPDDFTSAEAKDFNSKIDEAREEAFQLADQLRRDDDELRSVETEIYDTMVERLRVAGRATDVATSEAMLYPAFYRTMAERSGLSTAEFLDRYPLPQVQGAAPAGMQLKDVSALNRTLAEARARRAVGVEKGVSLMEFIDSRGGVDDAGGDIAAMDAAVVKRGRGRKTLRIVRKANPLAGMASMFGGGKAKTEAGLDTMAHAAYEAGYMATDPRVMAYHAAIQSGAESVDIVPAFLDAIRAEMSGARDHGANVSAEATTDGIDTIEEFLAGLGVGLDNTDEEIRAAMERGQQPGDGAMYAQGSIDTASAAFQAWFGDSKVVDADGKPLIVYHGTTGDFSAFDPSKANPESDLGAGFYFSNTAGDVDENYAGEGPDLTNKLEREAERIASELSDERGEEIGYDDPEVQALARDRLSVQHGGAVMPVYLSMQNPAFLGGDTPTFLESGISLNTEPYMDEARSQLEGDGDGSFDDADVLERARDLAQENGDDQFDGSGVFGLIEAIREMEGDFDGIDADKLVEDLNDYSYEGGDAAAVMAAMKASEGLAYATDLDRGDNATSEVIRRAFQAIGFDGFVDATVDVKFGSQRDKGKSMAGMDEGTIHYIAFKPTQIKSQFNQGTWDKRDANILHQPHLFSLFGAGSVTLYRGAPAGADPKSTAGTLGGARFMTTRPTMARAYAGKTGNVVKAKVRFANLLDLREGQAGKLEALGIAGKIGADERLDLINAARAAGHDGIVYATPLDDAEYIVLDETLFQADGSGFGGGAGLTPRGSIQFPAGGVGRGETIISTFAGADLSTVIHESGHYFLTVFQDMAAADPAGPHAADFSAIKDWWHQNADAVARDAMAVVPGVTVTADDVRLALDAGTTGDGARDAAINVGMQEQFARGAEAYLMEGKSPSIELRSAFEKFRAWLLSIYRRAAGLNVAISDEMRGVFDRLLATDQQIADAKADAGDNAPMFATAEEMGLSADDYARFRKLYQEANDEAAAKVLNRIMAPIRRVATALYKAERKAVVADVTKALQGEPVFRAIQELRFGKGFDGEDVPALKLSRTAIETDYGVGHIQFLPGATKDGKGHRNAVFSDEGGVHPDIVAGMYGFSSGKDFLDALERSPDLADAIKAEVDKEMATRHSDPLTDGSIQVTALEATHSDKRGKVLAAELQALNDVAGYDRGLTFKEARETARRTLQAMSVRDASRADRFLTAERKAGEDAFKLGRAVTREGFWMDAARRKVAKTVRGVLKANDGSAAIDLDAVTERANANTLRNNETVGKLIEAKRRQLLNHMLYAESLKVADGVEALVNKAGKLNKSDARLSKARNVDYVRAARAIAAKFGLARAERDFDFNAWIDQLRADDAVTADALTTAIATYTQDAKPFKDLTVAEFGALGDAIESVLEIGKRARLLEVDGQAIERELAISELRDVLDQRPQRENEAMRAKLSKAAKFKVGALSVLSSLRRMEAWARDMDDGKAGVFTRYLVKPVMDAVGLYRNDKAARLRSLLAIIEPRKADLLGKAIFSAELDYTFENKGELLHALLHTGNESNLEKLLMGRGWSTGLVGQTQRVTATGKPSVDRQGNPLLTRGRVDTSKWDALVARLIAEGTLTKADFDTAQAIWDLMDAIKRPAQSAHRRVYGYYFQEVEPTALVTPFGTYRGGYVPAIADGDASADGQIRADQQALEAQQTSFMFPTTGSGFTKSRVQNYTTPLALNLMLLPAHMDKVLRFTHLDPAIRQTASLVTSGELRGAIDAVDKTILPNLITPWLQRTAQQAVEAQPTTPAGRAASKIFREMRKRVGVHTMFLNLVNTAQQLTGFSSAMVLVKPARLKTALIRFARGDADAMREEASDASAFMRDRVENAARELQGRIQDAIVKPTVVGGIDAFVQRHGYVLQQGTQNLIDVITWHAAYDQAIAGGMDEAAAVFEADSVIRRTMGDFSPENVSMFETGSAFTRLFTMFYSYFNGQANLVAGEMQTVMRTMGWDGAGRMFFIYMFGMAIPAIVGTLIVKAAGGDLDDDEEDGYVDELAEIFFGSQLSYLAGMVPGGSLATSMINRFNGQFYDDRISTSPVASALERGVGAPHSVWDAATGEGSAKKAVTDSLTALGLITGIPMGQLAKSAGYVTGVVEGSSRPEHLGQVLQGVASGRDGTEN